MSDDDKEPQGPFNPFIRFKNHVNSRIGTGVSVLTGANEDGNKSPAGDAQSNGSVQAAGSSTSCPGRTQAPGGPKRQSPVVEHWDDWCHVDPYSPHNLRHLPQPTPKDLPPGADPADFGYPEAFEDLMSASNPFRGNLMDLSMRAGLKKTASGAPVKPETPSAWVRRLYGDGLLPHPFIWEQPKLAGGIPKQWEAHIRSQLGTQHTTEQDHGPTSDIAKEFLDTIRRIDGIVGESFSKMEELMGQDIADMMRKAQQFAENAMSVFSEQRSEDHDPSSSHAKPEGDAKPASVSEEDRPATEQDLYEFIQLASADADKFLNDFLKSSPGQAPGQAPPPPERAPRDNPPVSETVEHDPYGGKTIRTSSEHVDMFGFIHSRTEVRRLNAKGETIDYDTRYSVRSGPRGDSPPQPENRPRSDAPVSVSKQVPALSSVSEDEQLERLRIALEEADESGLDLESLRIRETQKRIIQQEQQKRANLKSQFSGEAHKDYNAQLMLLEQNNKQRFREKQEAEAQSARSGKSSLDDDTQLRQALQDHVDHLRLMQEYDTRRRSRRARSEGDSDRPEGQEERSQGDQNKRRLVIRGKEEAEARPPPEKPQGSTNSESSGWFWR